MLKMTNNKIGIFDSGLGGLSVLKYLKIDVPGYHYLYLGDNARLPYGEKSSEDIYRYSCQAMDFLFAKGCALVIVACNTVSAQALRRLQQEYLPLNHPHKKILGVIFPLAEKFAKQNGINRIGVIGTKATIASGTYENEIKKINPNVKIETKSTPLLVPLIENGWLKKPETKMILKKYLKPLKNKQIQALILGCTHYPFLIKDIQRIMGKKISVPDPGKIVAQSLADYLNRHPELNLKTKNKTDISFYTTADINLFKKEGEKFLNSKIENIKKIKID